MFGRNGTIISYLFNKYFLTITLTQLLLQNHICPNLAQTICLSLMDKYMWSAYNLIRDRSLLIHVEGDPKPAVLVKVANPEFVAGFQKQEHVRTIS